MKNNTSTQVIAKEGWKYILFVFCLFVVSVWFDVFSWVFFVLLVFTGFLFRNPERLPAEDDDMAVLSPCDGTITNISKFLYTDGKEYIKVEIQKTLTEVSILRAPTVMNIKECQRRHGLFLAASSNLSKELGEKVTLTCKSSYSELFMNINAGRFARKIELFKTVGPLKSAQRFGILVEGNVELYLALDTRIKVAVGDEVKAGESVLGYFAHKGNISEN
ncbi:phosphatidylserine decarboxylase [Sulfurospirillum arcachonense]|uniref:phosphatidylserine decarboxylase n=1 Tax=Sulfurospirillum arcachonense TaxID=57666 RepID=UPI00046AA0DD|nr:phosphatidylserine decarboxylase [Sulfurospirillum arcachonense]